MRSLAFHVQQPFVESECVACGRGARESSSRSGRRESKKDRRTHTPLRSTRQQIFPHRYGRGKAEKGWSLHDRKDQRQHPTSPRIVVRTPYESTGPCNALPAAAFCRGSNFKNKATRAHEVQGVCATRRGWCSEHHAPLCISSLTLQFGRQSYHTPRPLATPFWLRNTSFPRPLPSTA